MFFRKSVIRVLLGVMAVFLFAWSVQAVDLKLFVNEPMGGRCRKNVKDAMKALKEVSNVRILVIPKYMSKQGDPDAPAAMVADEVLASNKGRKDGRLTKDEMVEALMKHGAVPYSAGYRVINTAQMKAKFDSGSKDFFIIDARNPEEYQEVHIPGSINILEKTLEQNKRLLPKDTNKQIIFYCNGVKCGKSKRAAKKAKELGYKNILVYAEGIPVWEEMDYPIVAGPEYGKKIETTRLSPTKLRKMIDSADQDFTIVDVRDETEYAEGHIPGAINIPVAQFAAKSGILDKKKKIIVYCNSGSRSYLAYRKLMKLAYKKRYQTLFADWKETGMEVEK